jgi:hypothetical protein
LSLAVVLAAWAAVGAAPATMADDHAGSTPPPVAVQERRPAGPDSAAQKPAKGSAPRKGDHPKLSLTPSVGPPPADAPEPPDPDPWSFSEYKRQRPQFLDFAHVNGARFAMAQLDVKDPPEEVLKTYRTQLALAGITAMEGAPEEGHGMHYLSFRPPGSHNLKTITLLPHGPGTLILASIGDPSPMLKPDLDGDHFPRPPGAEAMVRTALGEAATGQQRQGTFVVHGLRPQAVLQFYAEVLPESGYQLADPLEENPYGPLTFDGGRERITVSAAPDVNDGDSRVSVLWLPEGS